MLIVANEGMVAELGARHAAEATVTATMVAERTQFRRNRRAEDAARTIHAQEARAKELRTRTKVIVMETEGKRRTVRKVKTTCDKMLAEGKLPKHLKTAVDLFAQLCAASTGAAVIDAQDSTNRMTSSYDVMGGGSFGSKTFSDHQLTGMTAVREMKRRVPTELMPIFMMIMAEEVGLAETRKSLSQIGEDLGYKHKQASSAAAMAVFSVAAIIGHYLKEQGYTATNGRTRE
jgi:hypothetical protein